MASEHVFSRATGTTAHFVNRRDAGTVRERGQRVRYVLSRAKEGDVYTFMSRKSGVQTFTGHPWPIGDGPSESVMSVSEKVAALRADLETMKREK